MEFTGRILKVMPARIGVSERTGKEWKTQGFIFEYFEQPTDRYSDKVYLETFDENVINQLQENLPVRIGFGHRVREYTTQQGITMHINEIRIYKFEPQTTQQHAIQPQGGTQAVSSPSQPQQSSQDQTGEKEDDLPF